MVKASRGRWSARGGMARRGSFGRVKWSTHWRPHRLLPLLLLSRVFSFLRQLLFAGVSSTFVRRASRSRERPSIDPNRSFESLTKPDWSAFDDRWNTGQPIRRRTFPRTGVYPLYEYLVIDALFDANGIVLCADVMVRVKSRRISTTNPLPRYEPFGSSLRIVSYANSCTDTIKEMEVERTFVLGKLFGALEIRTTISP